MPCHEKTPARIRRASGIAALLFLLTTVAAANEFEITPTLGWASEVDLGDDRFSLVERVESTRLDEGSSFALIGNWYLNERWVLEFAIGRQDSEMRSVGAFGPTSGAVHVDIDVYEIGGQYQWSGRLFRPFVGVNVGQSRFDVDLFEPGSETIFSAAALAGVRIASDRTVGLRVDARYSALLAKVEGDSPLCAFGRCGDGIGSGEIDQLELRTGIIFRFGRSR